jgi:hypothetical protein
VEQIYVCQGVVEVQQRQEDGVFVLLSVEPFFKCPTSGCASTEVEMIPTREAPVIDCSNEERERPRLVYHYKGKCLSCGVSREGWYGTYMDHSTPACTPTIPHYAWLFHKG